MAQRGVHRQAQDGAGVQLELVLALGHHGHHAGVVGTRGDLAEDDLIPFDKQLHPEQAVVIGTCLRAAEIAGIPVSEGPWPSLTVQQVAGRTIGMAMAGGLTEPIILYGNLNLSHTSYTLPYLLEDWDLAYDELDVPVLVNKDMPTCTLKEQLFGVPQGKLKNHLAIGELTYDIYGYIDQSNNLGVREYVLVEGLDGLDPENLPFFVVTIPLDASEACVFAVSDLLMGVYGGEQ